MSNFVDGFNCLAGANVDSKLYNCFNSSCSFSWLLVFIYVISNITVLACIDRVLETNNQILGRVLALSILFAFIALGIYDSEANGGLGGINGGTITAIDIISLVILFIGMEIYGGDPEPDVELIANYYSRSIQPKKETTCCGIFGEESSIISGENGETDLSHPP
jgi:hypothetical protein